MPQIRVMTWNIQNLGLTKIGFDDVMRGIASVVVDQAIDLLVVLEINTVSTVRATRILNRVGDALNAAEAAANPGGPGDRYNTRVLSPNTGLEYYGFIPRDLNVLRPCLLEGPVGAAAVDPTGLTLDACRFRTMAIAAPDPAGVTDGIFPLLKMDRDVRPPERRRARIWWPGKRRPCLGLFFVENAANGSEYLPIVAHHFNPSADVAHGELDRLPNFHAVNYIPSPDDPAVHLHVDDQVLAVPAALVTGDFNVNYLDADRRAYYAALDDLGYSNVIGAATHLVTPKKFSARVQHDTGELAVSCYDNFFSELPALPAAHPFVVDVPGLIRGRAINLDDCVDEYAELDKRGFKGSDAYPPLTRDFINMLKGNADVNLLGALIGARLVSDHLPIITELAIP